MQYLSNVNSWYVIRVRSQSGKLAHLGLKNKRFEVLNPTYNDFSLRKDRKKVLTKPIFDGYMFIRTMLNAEKHLEILKTPGVIEILKNTIGPTPVPDDQIENVLLLERHVGNCFYGNNFKLGDEVFVREGPLAGLKGVIDKFDSKKLHIYLDAIPGTVIIDVDPQIIQLQKDNLSSLVTRKKIYI